MSAINFLASQRIKPSVVHTGRKREWRWIKVLYLLWSVAVLMHILCQFHHILQPASGMRGDEIRHGVVVFPKLFRHFVEILNETVVLVNFRLVHCFQDTGRNMLWRNAQVPACVVRDELFKEFFVLRRGLCQIGTDSRGDEDVFHALHFARSIQQVDEFTVARLQIRANGREEAARTFADLLRSLIFAFRPVHVGSRPTDVGDGPAKMQILRHSLGFFKD